MYIATMSVKYTATNKNTNPTAAAAHFTSIQSCFVMCYVILHKAHALASGEIVTHSL